MIRGEPVRSTESTRPRDVHDDRGLSSSVGCAIWGILNVTPDSFSDGGLYDTTERAIARGRALVDEGADVVDVGGESSRPAGTTYGTGFARVPEDDEIRRVVPVIEHLVGSLGARVSVDTVKPEVARRALSAGAHIVNDVSCGRSRELLEVVARAEAEVVLMHTRGQGEVAPPNTTYGDVVAEVTRELLEAAERAVDAGVARARVWLDPGLGFAKTAEQSALLLAHVDRLVATGYPILVGPSRKSFLGALAPLPDGRPPGPAEREGGTAAAVVAAVWAGARAVRVHDVVSMRQAVRVAEALQVRAR
ncbi:MAG: dihydropteroate synthase [Deltaproteobacteria bacterium]|nr:dihydropteroate synthase [Deltaproteobacteria bacterium]